jgi:acyl-CoA hydrolase
MKKYDPLWSDLNTLLAHLNEFNVVKLVQDEFAKHHNSAPGLLLNSSIKKLQTRLDAETEIGEEIKMHFRTRKMVKPGDLNPRGSLFVGRLMEWIDEECVIYASCQLDTTDLVTKIVGEIDFKASAYPGDIVEIGVQAIKFGTTSITVMCQVRNKNTKQIILTIDKIVIVKVDENGSPSPHGKTTIRAEAH